ncbi:putative ESAT-6-like protein 6 [Mycobacterium marinum]|uniref:WXG100 family type VII secretion target n=3 Tax=Mycobacterium marinum TaxID=1781 RepID=UPI000E3E1262|nr:WXG100 family type VII secretion target [Mycobacterium marinum]RFZ53708.1 putative ESAT-6-like protein 6 [Mycobacterium marinum]
MTINYQFGDVDAHGALIRAQAASLEAEHQAIVRDVLAAGDFWGGAGSVACQEFITQLGRNFQVIYEQANSHGQKVQAAGNNMAQTVIYEQANSHGQKVQAAGNNMAQTDSAVGSSWA